MAQFDNLSRQEKAERAFLKHLMRDKDTFLNYYESVDKDNFTNQHFKYVFEVLHDFMRKMINIISVMLYSMLIQMS